MIFFQQNPVISTIFLWPIVSEYQTYASSGAGAGVTFSQFMSSSSLASRFDGFSNLTPIDETLHEQRGIHNLKSMVTCMMAKSCQLLRLGLAPRTCTLKNTFYLNTIVDPCS